MTTQIKTPEAVLQAKGTFHLVKVKNKIAVTILECLMFILIFFGGAIAASFVNSFVLGFYAEANGLTFQEAGTSTWALPLDLISRVVMTIVTIVFCVVYQKRKMITLGFTKDNIIPQYLLGLLAGAGIFTAAVALAAVTGALSIKVSSAPIDITLYLVLILGWIIQGMSEEVICRGFFLVSLSRKLSLPAAVVLNSLAFAAMHLFNAGISVLAFINLTLFGIFASVVFLRTGNIWLVSALHSVWNFAQGNFFGILVSGNDFGPTVLSTTFNASKTLINGGDFGLEGGLAVTTVLVIGTLLVLFVPSNKDGKVE